MRIRFMAALVALLAAVSVPAIAPAASADLAETKEQVRQWVHEPASKLARPVSDFVRWYHDAVCSVLPNC